MLVLAGDVGATKTDLALVSSERGLRAPVAEATLPSGQYGSLGDLIAEFLAHHGDQRPVSACVGVAGPVAGGRAKLTNLPWLIDSAELGERLGCVMRLLNDLEATAYGVLVLDDDQRRLLRKGTPAERSTIAVIAPGTGLGKAFLMWDQNAYRACASEGGHAGFAPETTLETDLLRELMTETDHVSWEWVCSGPGIARLYRFLKKRAPEQEPTWLSDALAAAKDPAPVITHAALDPERPSPLCLRALELFVSILGAFAGDSALEALATGGVYIGGGIVPRILPVIERGQLLAAFDRKGPLSDLVRRIGVHVVLEPKTALLGAASHALANAATVDHA